MRPNVAGERAARNVMVNSSVLRSLPDGTQASSKPVQALNTYAARACAPAAPAWRSRAAPFACARTGALERSAHVVTLHCVRSFHSPRAVSMEIVFTVLILLLTVALSGALTRVLPLRLPLPLMQIAFGAMLAWPRLNLHVTFDPEIFMLLFIPPLLFADGWRIPKSCTCSAARS
jgi:CPA1 family monovalent cation:H+ antiporter